MKSDESTSAPVSPSILEGLFGPKVVSWPYSEETLQRALEVRAQQEITKQEYYRAEYMTRALELVRRATIAKVPGAMIPELLLGRKVEARRGESGRRIEGRTTGHPGGRPLVRPIMRPIVRTVSSPQVSSHTSSSKTMVTTTTPVSAASLVSAAPPVTAPPVTATPVSAASPVATASPSPLRTSNFASTYRFGSSLPPRHQLSPTRIGAEAVSRLGGNEHRKCSIGKLRHGTGHLRTLSLPGNVTIEESMEKEFERKRRWLESEGVKSEGVNAEGAKRLQLIR
ncbi:DEKNAAC102648 [Brettanomyces naardenensis]|uniref:DEKNAAC102648 n=1 Tax=Brettanomyces naardenensis TaxID=13370 RepID=A0A448YLI2_BRENA|nr:DEKNAAC102648 [Brettanomyces naardenensis]